MIFITVGTHDQQFTRLIRWIDKIAPEINEEIIIQTGFTDYIPKNCKSFKWAPSLDPYYKKARVVISHGGSSVWEFVYKHNKPLIVVPRQSKYNEHINEHQVEFAVSFEEKTGIKSILNVSDLTPKFLKSYKHLGKIDDKNLKSLQSFLRKRIALVRQKNE